MNRLYLVQFGDATLFTLTEECAGSVAVGLAGILIADLDVKTSTIRREAAISPFTIKEGRVMMGESCRAISTFTTLKLFHWLMTAPAELAHARSGPDSNPRVSDFTDGSIGAISINLRLPVEAVPAWLGRVQAPTFPKKPAHHLHRLGRPSLKRLTPLRTAAPAQSQPEPSRPQSSVAATVQALADSPLAITRA